MHRSGAPQQGSNARNSKLCQPFPGTTIFAIELSEPAQTSSSVEKSGLSSIRNTLRLLRQDLGNWKVVPHFFSLEVSPPAELAGCAGCASSCTLISESDFMMNSGLPR
jgi:hypothetical protein